MDVPALGKAAGRDGLLQVVHLVIVGGLCVFVIVYVCLYVCMFVFCWVDRASLHDASFFFFLKGA